MDEGYPYTWSQDPMSFMLGIPNLPTPSPTPPPDTVAALPVGSSAPVPIPGASAARPQSPYGASWCSSLHAVNAPIEGVPSEQTQAEECVDVAPAGESPTRSATWSGSSRVEHQAGGVGLFQSPTFKAENLLENNGDCTDGAEASEVESTRPSKKVTHVKKSVTVPPLLDLSGTTAARSRKMDASERELMLMKRRLRNRASAARSRQKQRNQVSVLSEQVKLLKRENERLLAENAALQEAARMGKLLG